MFLPLATWKKVALGGALLLAAAGSWWWYERGIPFSTSNNDNQETNLGNSSAEENAEDDMEEEELGPEDAYLDIPETESELRKTRAYSVDAVVCDGECGVYQNDAEAFAYCQAVCGLAPEGQARPKPQSCEGLEEIERDICLKDKAVADNDIELCQEIVDAGLRQSCQNRIAEEYFDQ